MKNLLFTILFFVCVLSKAQTMLDIDFNNYNSGNLNTVVQIDGTVNPTLGQGFWYTLVTYLGANVGNQNFQIVQAPGFGNTLNLIGDNTTDLIAGRNLTSLWNSRFSGNDKLSTNFWIYTGNTTATPNNFHIEILDVNKSKCLGGYILNTKTMELRGFFTGTTNGTTISHYAIPLISNAGGYVLTPNTWYQLAVSYNKVTGEIKWNIQQDNITKTVQKFTTSGVMGTLVQGLDVGEINFDYVPLGNTPTIFMIDNIFMEASPTGSNLSTSEVYSNGNINVFPSIVTDEINIIGLSENIKSEVLDMAGRKVFEFEGNSSDLSNLNKGTYILKVSTAKMSKSFRFIKR